MDLINILNLVIAGGLLFAVMLLIRCFTEVMNGNYRYPLDVLKRGEEIMNALLSFASRAWELLSRIIHRANELIDRVLRETTAQKV